MVWPFDWFNKKKPRKLKLFRKKIASLQVEWNKNESEFLTLGPEAARVEAWARERWDELLRIHHEADQVLDESPNKVQRFKERLLDIHERLAAMEEVLLHNNPTPVNKMKNKILLKIIHAMDKLDESVDYYESRRMKSKRYGFQEA